MNLEPLVGATAGVVLFGNPAGVPQLIGGAAVLAGLALSALRRPGRSARTGQDGQVEGWPTELVESVSGWPMAVPESSVSGWPEVPAVPERRVHAWLALPAVRRRGWLAVPPDWGC